MVSLGGLDVAYGANAQLVRTNIMVLGCDAADVTTGQMKIAHNLAQKRFPSALKPDYSACISGITSSPATALATDLTDDVEGGLIKTLNRVPLLGPKDVNALTTGATTSAKLPTVETILGVSAMKIAATTSSAADDLFTDADTHASTGGLEEDEMFLTHQLNAAHMANIMNSAESTEANQQGVGFIDLAPIVMATGATFTLTINANATAAADTWLGLVDASESENGTDSSGNTRTGTTLANLKSALATGYIVQVTSICKV